MRPAHLLKNVSTARASTLTVPVKGFKIPPKSTVFSAIQPTGVFHIGNYLGAVRSWVDIASSAPADSTLIFATADLHALTLPKDPAEFLAWRRQALACMIASGLDPDRCILYSQSRVAEHTQLFWILSNFTGMGYLNRMTQWKSKSNVAETESLEKLDPELLSKLKLGLFAYPALQCADILLHKSNFVPVGDDQSQHLELTRHVTLSFNKRVKSPFNRGKPIFPIPSTLFAPYKKIASLRDPSKKMSKSDPLSCVYITDQPDDIKSKIRRAVTDSLQGPITYQPDIRPGISNLILMASGLLEIEPNEFVGSHLSNGNVDHAQLKSKVTDVLIEYLAPVRKRYEELLMSGTDYIDSIDRVGTEKARESAQRTIEEVYTAVGLR